MSHKYTFQASFCGSHTITPLENQISSLSEVGAKALYSFAVFFPLSPTQTITAPGQSGALGNKEADTKFLLGLSFQYMDAGSLRSHHLI